MEHDLNNVDGRIRASQRWEWKRFLADRYWLNSAPDEVEENLMHNYGPPCYAP